jgi:hypothetical protein
MGFWWSYRMDEDTPEIENETESKVRVGSAHDRGYRLSRHSSVPGRVLRCRFAAPTLRVIWSIDQKREELLIFYWLSFEYDRIDWKNAAIVFSAGLYDRDGSLFTAREASHGHHTPQANMD